MKSYHCQIKRRVTELQKELEKLVNLDSGKITFDDSQIDYMLQNIGNLDPHLRDDVVYTLFARGFFENSFTSKQKAKIFTNFINSKNLFKGIDQPENDLIFLRTFSALLGSLILDDDKKHSILNATERKTLFNWSISYFKEEKDFRGYVKDKGWAHSVAHGSDFLGSTLSHPDFTTNNTADIFAIIETVFQNMQGPFIDDEEQRLAFAFFEGVHFGKIPTTEFNSFINCYNEKIYQQLAENDRISWYRLSSWLKLLQNWYFYFSNQSVKDNLLKKISEYNEQMGYQL